MKKSPYPTSRAAAPRHATALAPSRLVAGLVLAAQLVAMATLHGVVTSTLAVAQSDMQIAPDGRQPNDPMVSPPPMIGDDKNPSAKSPSPAPKKPNLSGAAQARGSGDPGMMGLPFPKTPQEAEKTVGNLLAHLATAPDIWTAGQVALAIEKIWRMSGTETVNLLIDRAANFTSKNQLDTALELLKAATALQPDYAEVWNRRAYVHYRKDNTTAALGDLRRALALDPNHFRALDGMAKILSSIGEKKAALKAYDALLAIYPEMEGAKEAAAKLRDEVEGKGI